MREHVEAALGAAADALNALRSDARALAAIEAGAGAIAGSLRGGGRVLSCGNGGSMCDAMHFAEELTGRFRAERGPLSALAVGDPAHLSCVGNDYGFEQVFERSVRAHLRAGDALVAISTSGRSPNVLAAARAARELGAVVVALSGRADCELGDLADVHIATPAGQWSDRVQELHIKVLHCMIELVERELFPASYG